MLNETLQKSETSQRTRCVVYTRVMGYHRPVESFNIGKKQEHKDRLHFCEIQKKSNPFPSFEGILDMYQSLPCTISIYSHTF